MKGKKKYVYYFGDGKADGRGDMKNLLGGKGAGLAEMSQLGIPVPSGFTITTEACLEYYRQNKKYPKGMWEESLAALKKVERSIGPKFGDPKNPLLVAVRSGARASMPGMMDTVLNLGLNDQTVKGLCDRSHNERFAYDAYRRFVAMFGNVVLGVKREIFERRLEEEKIVNGIQLDTDLSVDSLKALVSSFKEIVLKETKHPFPEDPLKQLRLGIDAVFNSWFGKRAKTYRRLNNIPETWGTGVSIVAMVFGNLGDTSGTGVAFTRDPSTGEKRFYGEFLFNAQGEDVVAGIRTPLRIDVLKKKLPTAYKDLMSIYKKLEKHYKDMLDIEFTIQDGKLFMLQSRVGKRTTAAALRIAVEMVKERLITQKTAISRIDPHQLDQLLHPMIDPNALLNILAQGLPASPGAAIGKVVFTAEEAEHMAERNEKVILVRTETSPEDIGGMHASEGIVTARGGMTSHAAVVARGMGKCCVAGCGEISIDEAAQTFTARDVTVKAGDFISLNGSTGEVILGTVPLIQPKMSPAFKTLMGWADKIRKLKVRTNADNKRDAAVARRFGAEGIGLCRTEHMFFEEDRILAVREMILADSLEARKKALAKLLPIQKADFIKILKEMEDLPVTIRLLDPPLHEFLPQTEKDLKVLSREMGVPISVVKSKVNSLHEFNPMLGHRGCRLGISYPEIYEMQVEAIIEAACTLSQKKIKVTPEIMIPLVATREELGKLRTLCIETAQTVMTRRKKKVSYTVGTMIELPRAALVADQIAAEADFFSFGTNDLTQTVFGLSRDDAGKFLPDYVEKKILPQDPFVAIDQEGVGLLMEIGVQKGRSVKPTLKIGICGEHGGEPNSVAFCHKLGLNYVSCSPYRVPIARLAAAQAAISSGNEAGHRATV